MSKPIIRHCKNCKWYECTLVYDCSVRYTNILYKRLRALFCRFYEKKEVAGNE